jgi:hypothetical protein
MTDDKPERAAWLMRDIATMATIQGLRRQGITTAADIARNLTSPGDGSALWADVVWVAGTRPISGNIYPNGRFRRLNFEADNVFVAPMSWHDPSFMKQTIPPALGPSYGFPAAHPLQYA